MSIKIKSVMTVLAVSAFALVSAGTVQAGQCKNGHTAKNFNQPAKSKILTLSARQKYVAKKRKTRK